MKTVLFVNSSSARYFRREGGLWRNIERPEPDDKVWVIANLPEESLQAFALPLLFGRDRSSFLEHRLASAYPKSQFRAAASISGGWFRPGTAIITGLTGDDAINRELVKLDVAIAGVWGMSMLLVLMAQHLSIADTVLVMPSSHYLRILVLKGKIPVLTRCIHRYGEENESDANEILRTCQHLENRHIFEKAKMPPVLYLGGEEGIDEHLNRAGLTRLPLPGALSPKGDAAFLHPLFEYAISTPKAQLAPLNLRARHLAQNLRKIAYAGAVACMLIAVLFAQKDFSMLLDLHKRKSTLDAELQQTASKAARLALRIDASGIDPALMRQATKFAALEMDDAPSVESMLQLAALAIADLPQIRIRSLSFRIQKAGERYCQALMPLNGSGDEATPQVRLAELQFTILLPANLPAAAQIEIRRHISAYLKTQPEVRLMQDPAAFSLLNTLKGGFGIDTGGAENLWCMSIPLKFAATGRIR